VSGLALELIFLLIVSLFWLAQFVRQKQRRQTPADAEAAVAKQPGSVFRPPSVVSSLAEGPRRAPAHRDRDTLVSAAPKRSSARRYSRSTLMGNRRAVQNAIVTAAILKPCRAHRPYGMD